jgi:hypothetical protein
MPRDIIVIKIILFRPLVIYTEDLYAKAGSLRVKRVKYNARGIIIIKILLFRSLDNSPGAQM